MLESAELSQAGAAITMLGLTDEQNRSTGGPRPGAASERQDVDLVAGLVLAAGDDSLSDRGFPGGHGGQDRTVGGSVADARIFVHDSARLVEQRHGRPEDVAREPAAKLPGVLWNGWVKDELPVAGRTADNGVVREGRGRSLYSPVLSRVSVAERPDPLGPPLPFTSSTVVTLGVLELDPRTRRCCSNPPRTPGIPLLNQSFDPVFRHRYFLRAACRSVNRAM